MEIKVGDQVKFTDDSGTDSCLRNGYSLKNFQTTGFPEDLIKHGVGVTGGLYELEGAEVIGIFGHIYVLKVPVSKESNVQLGWLLDKIKLFKSNNKGIFMNLKEKFAQVFKSEPQKSFNKAGITDSGDNLTADGQTVFLSYLLKKYGDDFKTTVVDALLADEIEKPIAK